MAFHCRSEQFTLCQLPIHAESYVERVVRVHPPRQLTAENQPVDLRRKLVARSAIDARSTSPGSVREILLKDITSFTFLENPVGNAVY